MKFQKWELKYNKVKEDKENYFSESESESEVIRNKSDAVKFIKSKIADSPVEYVAIIALDNSNKPIGYILSEGIHNQCFAHPNQIFRFLLSASASAFVMIHNHPGNSIIASEHDWKITHNLIKAGKILEIILQDHIIMTCNSVLSLRSNSRWN